MSRRRITAAAVTGAAITALPIVASAGNGAGGTITYQVTVENLSEAQPFSPAGVVVHDMEVDVWSVGLPATAAVAAIAEDANLGVYVDTYSATPGVEDAFAAPGGPIGPGQEATFEFDAERNDRISIVSMLVNTNDAFTGLDAVRLGNNAQVFELGAYDAGTEVNNELASHIPGPAGGNPFVREPEGAVITHHDGVIGVGDLDPAIYDWDDPVARITIEPMR